MNRQLFCYDIEVYKNFFSVTFISKDGNTEKVFYIHNDINAKEVVLEIRNFIQNEVTYLVGFNNISYDDVILSYIFSMNSPKDLLSLVYDLSSILVTNESHQLPQWIKALKYKKIFKSIDLCTIYRLHKVGKSLKLCGINLKHYKVQELSHTFSKLVEEKDIDLILEYNKNDVEITLKLYEFELPDIKIRYNIMKRFGFDYSILSSSKPNVADRIFIKKYADLTGLDPKYFTELRTKRSSVKFSECVFPYVSFKTKYMQDKLNELKSIDSPIVKKILDFQILINGKTYQLGIGGLHSVDDANYFISDETYSYRDADVASYYPSMMLQNKIKPEHLTDDFLTILNTETVQRLEAKTQYKLTKDIDYLFLADTGKIVINAVFGKLGSETGWFYDPKAFISVTLNGQLLLLMLIEELEMNGIEVISANTDGVVAKIHKDKEDLYKSICSNWMKTTNLELEFSNYKAIYRTGVNSYLAIDSSGKIKKKSQFEENKVLEQAPKFLVVAKALNAFLINKTPIEKFIRNHTDIYDFCASKKIGHDFDMYLKTIVDGKLLSNKLQKVNRYYVSKSGGLLFQKDSKKEIGIEAGTQVCILNNCDESLDIKSYNINYSFYEKETNKILQQIFNRDIKLRLF